MANIHTLVEWLEQNPGPWDVAMWTCTTDNISPLEQTAGYFVSVMDSWQIQDNVFSMGSQKGSELVLVEPAIGTIEGGVAPGDMPFIKFTYHNLAVQVEGFHPNAIFTINKRVEED